MNYVLFFSEVGLAFIRLIGLGIGLDYLLSRKNKRFQGQVAGWTIWTLASIFQIIAQSVQDLNLAEILDVLFAVCTLVGSFIIAVSIVVYFRHVPVKFVFSVTVLLLIIPIFVYMIMGVEVVVNFCIFLSFILVGGLYSIGIIERINFRAQVGESIKWFYAIIGTAVLQFFIYVFISFQGINLGISSVELENEILVGINNSFSMAILVLTVVLLIHLENTRSNLYNFQLKDKYSHDLGNILQVMVSAFHIIEEKEIPADEREKIINLLNQKSQEVSDLIQEIRNLE